MEWIIEKKHEGMLLRDYLREVRGFSRRILKAVKFDGGAILVNGIEQSVRYPLSAGDKLMIHFPKESRSNSMQPEPMELSIIYEDNDILVINKASGLPAIPSFHHPNGTLANGLLAHYEKQKSSATVHIVTRLDRDTSGLLLVAKHSYSHSILAAQQQTKAVQRTYQAIVEGCLSKQAGTIHVPIGRKPGSIIEREIRSDGKDAVTHYKVEKKTTKHSFITVQLETGRTHQIRVHFSGTGYPLCGDTLYGGSTHLIKRQALHCSLLSFIHPITKELLYFTAELPQDMVNVLQKM